MKKITFRFWLFNILIGFVLYLIYRLAFMGGASSKNGNFIDNVLDILEVVLNLAYASVYLMGMILCSLLIFLNLIESVRTNYVYSLLTFLGMPLTCVIYVLINISSENLYENFDPMTTFASFSIIYVLVLTLSFLYFRKTLRKCKLKL